MMGRQSRQMAMVFVDMASLIPENHLLRKIDGMVSFDFIYGLLAPYYSATGRPSVDPVSMFKMLLVGYLYGIKSERRLVEEIRLNIAYRWFCGFELDDAIPDHSTFSKTRTRKWQQSGLFQNAFYEIVKQCIACGLIDGKAMAADGSYIPANVSRESWVDVETEVEQSMQSYLDALDEELSQQPGFKKPPERTIKKRRTTSRTDPDSGYINHGNKRGIGYLMEATVDCKHGILTGVDVYPANEKESLLVLRHLEQQIKLGVPMNQLALDRGYDTGAVHRGLELLGVTGYIPAIQFPNAPEKYGFSYNPQRDAFICPEGVGLTYHRLNCNQSTGKYLRCYQIEDDACKHCVKRPSCFDKAGIRRRVLASSCYPAFFRGHQRVGTPEFLSMMRLRKIWAEGSFSVLKREHCISKIRKRGILAATEECLLAAMALNLKRMASAVFFYLHISYSAGTTAGFGSFLAFVNGSNTIRKVDLLGITGYVDMVRGNYQAAIGPNNLWMRDIYIGHNYMEDIGQGGIDLCDAMNAVVEYNVVDGFLKRYPSFRPTVALYPWKSENAVFQFNEVYNGPSTNADGSPYDMDSALKNVVYQFNYSHNNPCGWMLYMGKNDNDIIRYNISDDGGDFIIKYFLTACTTPTYFLNNVIIYDGARTKFMHRDPFKSMTYFYNNVFYNKSETTTTVWHDTNRYLGNLGQVEFSNNCFYEASGQHSPYEPNDPNKITENPQSRTGTSEKFSGDFKWCYHMGWL